MTNISKLLFWRKLPDTTFGHLFHYKDTHSACGLGDKEDYTDNRTPTVKCRVCVKLEDKEGPAASTATSNWSIQAGKGTRRVPPKPTLDRLDNDPSGMGVCHQLKD